MNITEQTENYWIVEDKFIFGYSFNSPLDKYIGIIGKYNQLIFSNYDDLKITLETNNMHNIEFSCLSSNSRISSFIQKINQ